MPIVNESRSAPFVTSNADCPRSDIPRKYLVSCGVRV